MLGALAAASSPRIKENCCNGVEKGSQSVAVSVSARIGSSGFTPSSWLSPESAIRAIQFEELIAWWLQNDPSWSRSIKSVWRWDAWPGRDGPDVGVDLVAEHRDGSLTAVQCKAYSETTSVTKASVDSFITASPPAKFQHRLLVASTDRIGANARKVLTEHGVGVVVLDDLKRSIVTWPTAYGDLGDPAVAIAPRKPRPHQVEAVRSICEGLSEHDRGLVTMACGTGKTLTALWVLEQLAPDLSVVLVPSLNLLSQTLNEWTSASTLEWTFLCVCSDESVANSDDVPRSQTIELGHPVTTDAEEIQRFVGRPGRKIIFGTYQSSDKLGTALKASCTAADIVFCDEAHRLVGRTDGAHSAALTDDRFPARKRLFLTATPRTYERSVRRSLETRGLDVSDMNDDEIFGPRLYSLPFGEAIERDLLTDYQVVIIGVPTSEIASYAASRTLVSRADGATTDRSALVAEVATVKAIKKFGLQRLISFHARVSRAESFAKHIGDTAAQVSGVARSRLQKITALHVNGAMATSQRAARLMALRDVADDSSTIVTNARCLTEGVDVPELDGVVFADPKRSKVDVVQAVGRAIRRAPDKKVGTIVLPVIVPDGEDAADHLEGSDYRHVWNVLGALRAHDDVLAEQIDGLREQLGRTGRPPKLPPKIVIDVPGASEETIKRFSEEFSLQVLSQASATWSWWFGVLQRYVEREGDARVPRPHVEHVAGDAVQLGAWVSSLRGLRRSRLSVDQVTALEALPGWSWAPHDDRFDAHLRALRRRVARLGTCSASVGETEDDDEGLPLKIGHWSSARRSEYARGKLTEDRITLLESLTGWVWVVGEAEEALHWRALEQFAGRVGHGRVPKGHVETVDGTDVALGKWLLMKKTSRKGGSLSEADRSHIESLPNWSWDFRRFEFDLKLLALQQFLEREGHLGVPLDCVEEVRGEAVALGRWIRPFRSRHARGHVPSYQIEAVERIPGWTWDPFGDAFESGLAALDAFIQEHGHARAPLDASVLLDGSSFDLGVWTAARRSDYSGGKLSNSRIAALEARPGWVWSLRSEKWQRSFTALSDWLQHNALETMRASTRHDFEGEQIRIGQWASVQRSRHRKGSLTDEQVRQLESLDGWWWEGEDSFERGLSALNEWIKQGHSAAVPTSVSIRLADEEFALGSWCSQQRQKFKRGELTESQANQLEALDGWVWDPKDAIWEQHFEALRRYVNNNRALPKRREVTEDGLKLGDWVSSSRAYIRRGMMRPDRIARLEALPYWVDNAQDAKFNQRLAVLRAYVETHGEQPGSSREAAGVPIGRWVSKQRSLQAEGKLPEARQRELEAIPGWWWQESS